MVDKQWQWPHDVTASHPGKYCLLNLVYFPPSSILFFRSRLLPIAGSHAVNILRIFLFCAKRKRHVHESQLAVVNSVYYTLPWNAAWLQPIRIYNHIYNMDRKLERFKKKKINQCQL